MSSELRLKKLRGSGGYIMANVTDQQQQKGNLGGPDLFLASIGRLDSEKISKYFCNTCEKEYEASPKIEYENPNEAVAENLTLVEKGQYICTTCGSVLAEYREFQKLDELRSVGNANPISMDQDALLPPPTDEAPLTMPDFSQIGTETPVSSQTQPIDTTFNSISGMVVYDENAKRVGTAKQVGVDSSQKVVLVVTNNEGNDVTIPWDKIGKVGEIILLGTSAGTDSQSGQCSSCNFVNKAGSKFCEQCGTTL